MITELTQKTFDEKISDTANNWNFKGSKPCIVDFHAPWCGYCKSLAPLFKQLSEEYEGLVDFYTVNVDEEEHLESKFNIRTIPTLLLAKAGAEPILTLGVLSKQQLKALIDEKFL